MGIDSERQTYDPVAKAGKKHLGRPQRAARLANLRRLHAELDAERLAASQSVFIRNKQRLRI